MVQEHELNEESIFQVCNSPEFSDPEMRIRVINILQAAAACGEISYNEIATCIPPELIADRERLASVLQNLITLLGKHNVRLVEEGTLTIEKENTAQTPNDEEEADYVPKREPIGSDGIGCFFRNITPYARVLKHEEVIALMQRVEQGDREARDLMILHNVRLATYIAKRYMNRGIPYLDLVQEGIVGLMRVIDGVDESGTGRYDYRKGYRFSSYATWWVRHKIVRTVVEQQTANVRVPQHIVQHIRKVFQASEMLMEKLGREPTPQEIALHVGLTATQVHHVFIGARVQRTMSLHAPLQDGNESNLEDVVADERAADPSEGVEKEFLARRMEEVLNTLTPREQLILRLRFGFGHAGEGKTLEEIAKELKLTRERVRQIEAKAIRKLRAPERLAFFGSSAELWSKFQGKRSYTFRPTVPPPQVRVMLQQSNVLLQKFCMEVFYARIRYASNGRSAENKSLIALENAVLNLTAHLYSVEPQSVRAPEKDDHVLMSIQWVLMRLLNQNGVTQNAIAPFLGITMQDVRRGLKTAEAWMEDAVFALTMERLTPLMWRLQRNCRSFKGCS